MNAVATPAHRGQLEDVPRRRRAASTLAGERRAARARRAARRRRRRAAVHRARRRARTSATAAASRSPRRTSTRRTRARSPARSARRMLVEAGCTLGHRRAQRAAPATSARRDAIVAEKVAAALAAGLRPIVCVGETLARARGGRARSRSWSARCARSSTMLAQSARRRAPSRTSRCGPSAPARTPARPRPQEVHAAIRGWLAAKSADARVADAHPLRRLREAGQRRRLARLPPTSTAPSSAERAWTRHPSVLSPAPPRRSRHADAG